MTTPYTRRFSTDSPVLTGRSLFSGANFREVAPEILSPLSFSLVGAGMENAFRDIGRCAGVEVGGDRPRYVAYLAFRPFHGMSEVDRFVGRMPFLERDDVWELLLGGPAPATTDRASHGSTVRKACSGVAIGRFLALGNGSFADSACSLVAEAEARVLQLSTGGASFQAGAALERAFVATRHAWALHTRTTTLATGAAALLRRLFERDYDDAAANEVFRHVARRAGEAAHASASAARLADPAGRLQNYEVADRTDRFGRFSRAAHQATRIGGGDRNEGELLVFPTATISAKLADRVARQLDSLLSERERSKELGLRALHTVRLALESSAVDLDPADAALLGADELLRLPRPEQLRLIARRAEELEEAATLRLAPDLREQGELVIDVERPTDTLLTSATGTPLAPGWAEGALATESTSLGLDDEIICGTRVDGNYVLAARPAGVVTTHGSLLSHVAIVCRELGIPLVSNVSLDPDAIHGRVIVDGWTGDVMRVA